MSRDATTCPQCDQYDADIEIHGPVQLRRIVDKVKAAVREGQLTEQHGNSVQQPSFLELHLGGPIPDGIEYRFECSQCKRHFVLECEMYHGAGGRWCRA